MVLRKEKPVSYQIEPTPNFLAMGEQEADYIVAPEFN